MVEQTKLFHKPSSPVRIGGLEFKNRAVTTPMGVNLSAAEVVLRAGHQTMVVDKLPQIGVGANIIGSLSVFAVRKPASHQRVR